MIFFLEMLYRKESDIVDIQQVLTVGVNSDKVSTESDLIWFFNLFLVTTVY